MRILAVPNWSFSDAGLLEESRQLAIELGVVVHYWRGDHDHARCVTAFSGELDLVFSAMLRLASFVRSRVGLSGHTGVHPRVGLLDVAPFVNLQGSPGELVPSVRAFAQEFSSSFGVPIYLYEQSAAAERPRALSVYRSEAFQAEKHSPDFGFLPGPEDMGVTVMGVRDFLLAVNINFRSEDIVVAKGLAREIRKARDTGVLGFKGVRALGFMLERQNLSQLSMNMTLPDETSFDEIYNFVVSSASVQGARVVGTELIGVIRERDLATSTWLEIDPAQVAF